MLTLVPVLPRNTREVLFGTTNTKLHVLRRKRNGAGDVFTPDPDVPLRKPEVKKLSGVKNLFTVD